MIAICPAGPPKLINPSLSQNQNASFRGAARAYRFPLPASATPFCSSWPDLISNVVNRPSNSEQAAVSNVSSSVMLSRNPASTLSTPAASGLNPAYIKVMYQHCQTIQGIPRQPEADHQYFKGHAIVDVAEGRPIKIKPHCLCRTIVAIFKPEKLRVRIDKTPYKPCAGKPVNPWSATGCPDPVVEILRYQLCQFAADGVGLAGRDEPVNACFQFRQAKDGLRPRFTRKKSIATIRSSSRRSFLTTFNWLTAVSSSRSFYTPVAFPAGPCTAESDQITDGFPLLRAFQR